MPIVNTKSFIYADALDRYVSLAVAEAPPAASKMVPGGIDRLRGLDRSTTLPVTSLFPLRVYSLRNWTAGIN